MSNVVTIKGTLLAGPSKASCNGFPSALVNAAFELTPSNKIADASCYNSRTINSPASFVALQGVGTDDAVTQGTFLWMRTSVPMSIRVTQGTGDGAIVSVLLVQGIYMQEFPVGTPLTLLEAEGVGVLEYFASGNQ